MLRVAYLTSQYPAISHTFIQREILALREAGVDVDTFSIRKPSPTEPTSSVDKAEQSKTFYVLPVPPLRLIGSHLRTIVSRPRSYAKALFFAVTTRPPGQKTLLWQLFYFVEAVYLWYQMRRRGIKHVHVHFAMACASVAVIAHQLGDLTYSMTVHGPAIFYDTCGHLLREKVRYARMVCCISDFCRSQVMANSRYEDWAKLQIVHCGVAPDSYVPRPPPPESHTTTTRLLNVARLSAVKAHANLLAAIADLEKQGHDIACTIVGDGPERLRLKSLSQQLGISSRVRFTGSIDQDRIQRVFDEADIFVLPSFAEGVPVVLMEAMAKGLPVVASRIMGIPELVEHGVSGLLVPPGAVVPLAEAIASLAKDAGLRRRMGEAGRRKVCCEFNVKTSASKLAQLFGSLLSKEDVADTPCDYRAARTMCTGLNQRSYLVISPVRDEAKYIQRTIDSMVAQTIKPSIWIIVDDGSSDDTADVVAAAARKHDWIRLRRRLDRGGREVGGGVIEAFYDGLSQVSLADYEYVCKLDGDLEFGPRCFQRLIEKLEADPFLGTVSGKCWDETRSGWVRLRTSDEFSMGACKFYRVACFEEIGGFVREAMWDGIDCHRCRMKGWQARSFHDDDMRLNELRPMGSSHKSVFHGRFRWGRGQYFMGTHWLYALAIAVYRAFERPFLLGGLCILAGYASGYLRRVERYEDSEFRRYLRKWQLARLKPH